jgi:hypothetical protein
MSTKFKSDEILVCALAFAMEHPAGERFYKKWLRVRGDDPAVKVHPEWFVLADEATDAILSKINSDNFNATMTRAYSRPSDTIVAPPTPKPIAVEDQRVCIKRVFGGDGLMEGGRPVSVLPGQVVSNKDEVAKKFPGNFRPVNPKRLDPREAVIATAELVQHFRPEEGRQPRKVYPGEWLAMDDPLVEIHPHSFVGAPFQLSSYRAD